MNLGTYKITIRLLLCAALVCSLMWRCASIVPPDGGPRDSLPPRIVAMTPQYGKSHFADKRITIEFDEYVTIKDQQKEFFVSPPMGKAPTITIRGRGIQIDLKDTLAADQTYALNFGNSIRDNNEGNPVSDFRYVFSTGERIDSMLMSGYAVDAYALDSMSKTFIFFYPATEGGIQERDSTLFGKPAAIARAQGCGIFIAENLKPIPYRIYAFQDKNGNQTYDPGVDKVAFLDSTCNPAEMPPFSIRYDTTRFYNVADPQLCFRLFMDQGFRRQYLVESKREWQHRIVLSFGAANPVIERLEFKNIDSSRVIRQYLKPTRDSIAYWLDIPAGELPDTVKAQITYLKHDSLRVLTPDTQELSLVWRSLEKKRSRGDTLPERNPFQFKVSATATLNPYNNIPMSFDYPLSKIDSANVTLTRTDADGKRYRSRVYFQRDTADMRNWVIHSPWVAEAKYELLIPAGALVNVAGQSNDTLKAQFSVAPVEKFATLELNVKGKSPDSEYIIELLDKSGKTVRRIPHARQGKLTVEYLDPGQVRIRIVEDLNGNGLWDPGCLVERRQPERVEIFALPSGDMDIITREAWTLDFDLDMNRIFGPITMQSVMEQLRHQENARMERLLKEQQERQDKKNNKNNQTQSQPANRSINPTGGGFRTGTDQTQIAR